MISEFLQGYLIGLVGGLLPVSWIIRCEILHFLFGSAVASVAFSLISTTFLSSCRGKESQSQSSASSTSSSAFLRMVTADRSTFYFWLLLSFSFGVVSHILADALNLGF